METHDQKNIQPIPETPQRIPQKPVPLNQLNGTKNDPPSSSPKCLGYTYNPIQTSSSPQNSHRHSLYAALLLPSLSSASLTPSHAPVPPGGRRGLLSGGWRSGCTYCAITTATVFLINLSLTVWAYNKYKDEDGVGTFYEGECDKVKSLSLAAHLVINALSAVLLSASNYTMQCLSAPTRAEVDRAHAVKQWLDIGIPSVKNLRKISGLRLTLWFLLAISSIPLHLIYNSAVFSTTSGYEYISLAVSESQLPIYASGYQKLDNRACMKTYGKQFLVDRRDLLIVVSGNGTERPQYHGISLSDANRQDQFSWICEFFDDFDARNEVCNINNYLDRAASWRVNGRTTQYCLSELMPEKCSLQYSTNIMIAVIIFNALKSIFMFLAVFKSNEDPLVTVGDAIASFLNKPDKTTIGMCIVSRPEIDNGIWESTSSGKTKGLWRQRLWKPRRHFWFRAASLKRWVVCNSLALIGILTTCGLFARSLIYFHKNSIPYDIRFLWSMGFGTIDTRAITTPLFSQDKDSLQSLVPCVITANLPQAIFSFLYLLYNSIFTCMLLGNEWDNFSKQRRALRVTTPTGAQRSTHFLQLPYTYSLPLMVVSGCMHWVISQSIFLARIGVTWSYTNYGDEIEERKTVPTSDSYISLVGWSPIAIIFGIILACFMLAAAMLNGLRRYSGGIPLMGNCSAVISAACHPDPKEPSVATGLIMWGVIKRDKDVGHCTFSTEEVATPVPYQHYAGTSSVDRTGADFEL